MRIQRCEGAHRSEGSHDLYWGRSGLSIWVGCNPAPLSLWPSPEISQFHSLMKYPPPLPRRGRVGWEKPLCINGVRVKIMSCCFKPVIASDISQRGCSVLVSEHGLLRMHEKFMNMCNAYVFGKHKVSASNPLKGWNKSMYDQKQCFKLLFSNQSWELNNISKTVGNHQ